MKNNLINVKKNCNANSKKNNKGITLVALIITIIVLLILVGVTLNMVIGNSGILKKATVANNKTSKQTAYEELKLKVLEVQTLYEGKATLKNIVDALRDDKKYTYTVNSQETAILAVYKGYEFEIKDNLEVSYIRNTKKEYKISYNLQGGVNEKIQSQIKIDGKKLILNSEKPKKSGYLFKGWSVNNETDIVLYQPGDEFDSNEDTTLYAIWEELYLLKNGTLGAGLNFNNIQYNHIQVNGVPFTFNQNIERTPPFTGRTNSNIVFQDLIQTNEMYAKLRVKYSISWPIDPTYCYCCLYFSLEDSYEYLYLPFTNGQIQTVESNYIPIKGSKLTLDGCDGNIIIYEIDIIEEKDSI